MGSPVRDSIKSFAKYQRLPEARVETWQLESSEHLPEFADQVVRPNPNTKFIVFARAYDEGTWREEHLGDEVWPFPPNLHLHPASDLDWKQSEPDNCKTYDLLPRVFYEVWTLEAGMEVLDKALNDKCAVFHIHAGPDLREPLQARWEMVRRKRHRDNVRFCPERILAAPPAGRQGAQLAVDWDAGDGLGNSVETWHAPDYDTGYNIAAMALSARPRSFVITLADAADRKKLQAAVGRGLVAMGAAEAHISVAAPAE